MPQDGTTWLLPVCGLAFVPSACLRAGGEQPVGRIEGAVGDAARLYAAWLDELIAATEKRQAAAKDSIRFEPVLTTCGRSRALYAGAAVR